MIEYSVLPVHPEAHIYAVGLRLNGPFPNGLTLSLPAWIPGSYMIRDFAKNITSIRAACTGDTVAMEKRDKQTWVVGPCDGVLNINYRVYAWDLSVRGAHLDTLHGYFNGTSLFLRVHGHEDQPCRVSIYPPEGQNYTDWRIATTLKREQDAPPAFGDFLARDYADLIDHPVEMGSFDYATFDVGGVEHAVALSGRHRADMQRLCTDLQRVCTQQIALFGELPPMDRYLFQVMAVGDGYGGLEHRSSTSLLCKRDDLPKFGEKEPGDGYRQFLGLASHEYFHLWNVKRIRPKRLMQADLTREVYTGLLWAFEGITSYYDDLMLVRAGLIKRERYLELLARTVTRVMRTSGRRLQSVAESSFDAWTKFYKQDENAPNAIVSYYAKGALVALALDLTLRERCAGVCTLDHVMRALWQEHGRTDQGVGESELERMVEQVSGLDLKAFFDLAVRGTGDLPLQELLATVGVGYRLRPARDTADQGGYSKPAGGEAGAPRSVLGGRCQAADGGARVTHVFDAGAAQAAGVAAGDLIIAIDEIRVCAENIDDLIAALGPEERVSMHLFRRDELLCLDFQPRIAPKDTCDLWLLDGVGGPVRKRREAWLGAL